MTDLDLLALNVFEEAGGEIDDGKAAVARVVKNRMRLHFMSDGTVGGTVLARDQFSWAWFHFITKVTGTISAPKHTQAYVRAAKNFTEANLIAENLLKVAAPTKAFGRCRDIAQAVMAGTYVGPIYDPATKASLYSRMTDDAVSYLNPKILTRLPSWAIPDAEVCVIGRHHFYREAKTPALV